MARPVIDRLWNVERSGYDRLPTTGPAILCPNHISFLDSAFLMLTAPRNISFVGKAEYMDSWQTKYLFPALGMIPIDRSGGAKSLVALDAAKDVLERGELFAMFPEGTRSRSGKLYRGRTGAARLAIEMDVPVFPVGIVGTADIQPPDAKMPHLGGSCSITIGEPIEPARYFGQSMRVAARALTDEIMYEIGQLTGQEYVHIYSDRDRGDLAEAATPVVPAEAAAVARPARAVAPPVEPAAVAPATGDEPSPDSDPDPALISIS